VRTIVCPRCGTLINVETAAAVGAAGLVDLELVELDLPLNLERVLSRAGIRTIGQFAARSEATSER
jgi:hypothetical protein